MLSNQRFSSLILGVGLESKQNLQIWYVYFRLEKFEQNTNQIEALKHKIQANGMLMAMHFSELINVTLLWNDIVDINRIKTRYES